MSWDVLFALTVGLHFIFGSVGIGVGQNVMVVRIVTFLGSILFIFLCL